MNKDSFEHSISQGFRVIIMGCCLLIGELLLLPLYAYIAGGHNLIPKWMEYAGYQPMPLVFTITGIIIILGIVRLTYALKQKYQN